MSRTSRLTLETCLADFRSCLCNAARNPEPHPVPSLDRQLGRSDGRRRYPQGHIGLRASSSDSLPALRLSPDLNLLLQGVSALSIDEFDVPALSQLQNVTIGSRLEGELRKLNSSLPTLSDVRDKLDSLCVLRPSLRSCGAHADGVISRACSIDEPFDLMTNKINATTSNFTFEPSSSGTNATATSLAAMPLSNAPGSSLCADLDLSFVDDLGHDLQKIRSWGIGLLVVAMWVSNVVFSDDRKS